MNNIKKHFNLLGYKIKDKVSDFSGVVVSISFDLYGCIQSDVRPTTLNSKNKISAGFWCDISRLNVLSEKLIDPPNFKNNKIKKYFNLLGHKVKDKISSFEGIVISISFDIYNNIQAYVRPTTLDENGGIMKGYWINVKGLEILTDQPLMKSPNFKFGYIAEGKKGPANLPIKEL